MRENLRAEAKGHVEGLNFLLVKYPNMICNMRTFQNKYGT